MKKWTPAILVSLFILYLVFLGSNLLTPVPQVTEQECLHIEGKVVDIEEVGHKDILFSLDGINTQFYINRGLEKGLSLASLETELIGKDVTISYPDYSSLLGNGIKHLSKLESQGKVIYTELQQE